MKSDQFKAIFGKTPYEWTPMLYHIQFLFKTLIFFVLAHSILNAQAMNEMSILMLKQQQAQMKSMSSQSENPFENMNTNGDLMQKMGKFRNANGTVKTEGRFKQKVDSLLLEHSDTALVVPWLVSTLDSLDSLHKVQGYKRYEQRIFAQNRSGLFSSTSSRVGSEYPLKSGDELTLTLWGDQQKEWNFQINMRGEANLEGVGVYSLNGLTLAQAESKFKAILAKSYSTIQSGRSKLSLQITKLSPIKVFVLGEVQAPGSYVFHGNTSIFLALQNALGPNDYGSVRQIQVQRDGKTQNYDLYPYLYEGKASQDILRDGDVVFLPRAQKLVNIQGAVLRPGIYEMKEGEEFNDLVKLSGGKLPKTASKSWVLNRTYPDGHKDFLNLSSEEIQGQIKMPLFDGDSVFVPEANEKDGLNVTIKGAIKYPGTYQFRPGLGMKELVDVAGGVIPGAHDKVQILRPLPDGTAQIVVGEISQNLGLKSLDTVWVYHPKFNVQKDTVTISGAVVKPGKYVFYPGMTARALVLSAGGFVNVHDKVKFRIDRVGQENKNDILWVDFKEDGTGQDLVLQANDHVAIPQDPKYSKPNLITITGALERPGKWSLFKRGEKVSELLKRTGSFLPTAYTQGIEVYRLQKIKVLKKDSLVVGKPPKTSTDSVYIDTLVVLGVNIDEVIEDEDSPYNIPLFDGDSLVVPEKRRTVKVSGDVGVPGYVMWQKNKSISWYIERSGGLSQTADDNHISVIYGNGERSSEDDAWREPDEGSEIIVPKLRKEEKDWLTVLSSISTIVGSLASTVLTVLVYQNSKK